MIRLLLMALGAYTLYRIYAPVETGEPPQRIADQRAGTRRAKGRRRAAGARS
ncbi:hypothetical protein GTW25_09110 [Aliihoeflea aestuarii]|jgi:hypothetical protein|uniref:hypothetical protein n=1 Tax=Aliihoeflea aestuarii TaxID=453840 RepID=UPI0020935852|nr:hypothetical protein [Aliihoeflea aestuarii]MCO6391184.1 hypothetical protein [Aliihoeflea aestuarii]